MTSQQPPDIDLGLAVVPRLELGERELRVLRGENPVRRSGLSRPKLCAIVFNPVSDAVPVEIFLVCRLPLFAALK